MVSEDRTRFRRGNSRHRRRYDTPLKTNGGIDRDADNLNRAEKLMEFSAGRSLTPEEGKNIS
jgi:hypothetical protein